MRIDRSIRTGFALAAAAASIAVVTGWSNAMPAAGRAAQPSFGHASRPVPASSGCGLAQMSYALGASGEKISLPADCGGSGDAKVPALYDPSAGFSLSLCEDPSPIGPSSGPCAAQPTEYPPSSASCSESTNPAYDGGNTFLFATEFLTSMASGSPPAALFARGKIPLTFVDPAFAASPSQGGLRGAKIGLCVVAFGEVIQDDFIGLGGESPVSPTGKNGDAVHLKLVLPLKEGSHKSPPVFWPFPSDVPASVFFQFEFPT